MDINFYFFLVSNFEFTGRSTKKCEKTHKRKRILFYISLTLMLK